MGGARRQDPYARRAQVEGYRSRAVYKLIEIDQRDRLLRPGQMVLDLGAAPGSWSQYAARRVRPGGQVIAVDQTPVQPLPGVRLLRGDAQSPALHSRFLEQFGAGCCDLVLSDMAPSLSGMRDADQARSLALSQAARQWADAVLKPSGVLLVKLFQGADSDAYQDELRRGFCRVVVRKPAASRGRSRELYLLCFR